MKKKGMMGRMAATAVVLTLISTSLLSGTLAKYTSSVTVNDSAKVAKFYFELDNPGGKINPGEEPKIFSIFETSDKAVADGTTAQKLIAPGTNGKFDFDFVNMSEVAVEDTYQFTLSDDGRGETEQVPLVIEFNSNYYSDFFATGDKTVVVRDGKATSDTTHPATITGPITGDSTENNSLAKAVSDFKTGFKPSAGSDNAMYTYNFEWCWAFEGANKGKSEVAHQQSDKLDTALGNAGALTPYLNIVLTVTQLDNFTPGPTTVPTT